MQDEEFMREALELARNAEGRTSPNPMVGAVIVQGGRIVAAGWHRKAGTPHAEIHARRMAGELAKGATLYVTLEPCPMCAGAIVQARPGRIVFGATDARMGAVGGALSLFELPGVTHRPWVRRGVMAQEAKTLLADFFAARRGAKENEREGEGEAR